VVQEAIPPKPRVKWVGLAKAVALLACVAFVGWPQLHASFAAADRYRTQVEPDYEVVKTWLNAGECARNTGAWAAVCKNGRPAPLIADDPGHALMLGLWARWADRPLTFVDVARLNLTINAAGLLVLAATALAVGAFWTALVLLVLGPYAYLEWFAMSQHWSFIGLASMQVLLPLGLIAYARELLPRWASLALVGAGLLTLAFASLVREAIASMTLVLLVSFTLWLAPSLWRRGRRTKVAGLALVVLLSVFSWHAARITVAARDAVFDIDAPQAVATHGIAHNLYLGLGAVENSFGLTWDDARAMEAARGVSPEVGYYSREYFQIMWRLYFDNWRKDPLEVIRIYFVKLWKMLSQQLLDFIPALWLFLPAVVAIHWLANGGGLSSGGKADDLRLALGVVALSFIGLFVLQGVLASTSQFFSMPMEAFLMVLTGIALDDLAAGWRAVFSSAQIRALSAAAPSIGLEALIPVAVVVSPLWR
jgi:hypothetical protein